MPVLLLQGCAWFTTRHAPLPELQDPAGYLQEVLQQSQSVVEVSGLVSLKVSSGLQSATTRNVFFARRPDRLRIETLGFLSRPAYFFTADGQSMHFYDIQNHAFYSGESTPENFARITGIRFELAEAVSPFLGSPPLIDCSGQKIRCAQDNGSYRFTLLCPWGEELLWVDPSLMTIVRYRRVIAGTTVCEHVFSRFQNSDAGLFPLKIEINHYTYNTEITLSFESLSFDPVPDDRFMIEPPAGAEQYGLDALGSN